MVRVLPGLLIMLALLTCVRNGQVFWALAGQIGNNPTITINHAPPKGADPDVMEIITGSTSGVDATKFKVVMFTRTNTWYVQPYTASLYTAITEGGKWGTRTHLGDEYAAILVETAYQPPATTDNLPEVGGPALNTIGQKQFGPNSKPTENHG